MNESGTPTTATGQKRRRAWWRGGLAGGAGLVVILYFIVTSSVFFRGVILPRVSQALHAKITVTAATIQPLSKIVLHGLQVTPQGGEPMFTAKQVTVRYRLWSILRGHILVPEITVIEPQVTVLTHPDGTTNLDPLLPVSSNESAPAQSAAPVALDLQALTIQHGTLRYVQRQSDSRAKTVELRSLEFTARNIKNNANSQIAGTARLAVTQPEGDSVQAQWTAKFQIGLDASLRPVAVEGAATMSIEQATGAFTDLATLESRFECAMTPTDIQQAVLRFTKAGHELGSVRLSGPLDLAKIEGRLQLEVSGLDRQVLNLAGAPWGIDFSTTTLNAQQEIELTDGGALITAAGAIQAQRLQLRRSRATTPTLDVRAEYSIAVNRSQKSAQVKVLQVRATQNQRPLVTTELTSPLTLAWGDGDSNAGDAAFHMAVTGLDLEDWQAWVAEYTPRGIAHAHVKLLSHAAGRQIRFEVDAQLDRFAAQIGAHALPPIDARLRAAGQFTDFRKIILTESRLELAQQAQPILAASTSGTFDLETHEMELRASGQATLPRLIPLFGMTNVTCSAGTVEVTGQLSQPATSPTVTGRLALANFTGGYGDYRLADFGATTEFTAALTNQTLMIRRMTGQWGKHGKFELAGQAGWETNAGQVTLALTDFTEQELRPWLAPSLGDKKLTAAALQASATAQWGAAGNARVAASLQLTNLVMTGVREPLALRLQVDASASNHVATVRQCQLALAPTARAANELNLTGTVDYSQPDAVTGQIRLAADALDVTAYYDLYAATNGAAPTAPPAAPSSATTATEPAALTLLVRDFRCAVEIGRLYLREVEVGNCQAAVRLDGGRVTIQPCQFTLNGAPVETSVDVDLGVPGYRYALTARADQVPLAPLANSFSPSYKDYAQGTLIAQAQIKGAGLTGPSLRQHLSGQVELCLTNAAIQIVGTKVKAVLTPIALALGATELLRSPLEYVVADLRVGNGQIETRRFIAHSAAFRATSQGTIPLADTVTDSPLSQPVDIALARNIASALRYSRLPVEEGFAKFPTFVHLAGTLGDPTAKTDKLKLAGLAVTGAAGLVDGATGGVLRQLGDVLTGQPSATTTNEPTKTPLEKIVPSDFLHRLGR